MDRLLEILSYEFVRNALVAGILASVLCGLVGTFVVVKRLVFISGGISHAAFGGLGMCYFLGLNPTLGAVAVAVLCAVTLGLADSEHVESRDAMIGVLWAVGMAVGIIFIHLTPGYAPNLMTYLFGNILTVSRGDLIMSLALDGAVVSIVVLFFKEFVAIAFDETFAAVQGIPVRALLTLLLVLIALSVVVLIQVVGIVLVIALLTIPPLIGLMLVRDFVGVLLASIGVGLAITLVGLCLSYVYDVPSGPAIVLLGALLMAVVYLAQKVRRASVRVLPDGPRA